MRLESADQPSVDWQEMKRTGAPVIAHETIDLSALHRRKPATLDQILARVGEALILVTREQSPKGTILIRTTLPLPLDEGQSIVGPCRPAPAATFGLMLHPNDANGIVYERSEKKVYGCWKNSRQEGAPHYVRYESVDRDRLRCLRTEVLGAQAAGRAEAAEGRQAELKDLLDRLSPDQRAAALTQAAMALKQETDRQFAAAFADLGDAPPEITGIAEAIQRKMEATAQQVKQKSAAAEPADPEALRRIEELLRDPGAR